MIDKLLSKTMSFKNITQLSFWNKASVKGKKSYILCLGTRFTNGNCSFRQTGYWHFAHRDFTLSIESLADLCPFPWDAITHILHLLGVSSFGGVCSTLSFSTRSICVVEFRRCFDKPPLAKRVCMLGFTSAFISSHPNSNLYTSSLVLFIT